MREEREESTRTPDRLRKFFCRCCHNKYRCLTQSLDRKTWQRPVRNLRPQARAVLAFVAKGYGLLPARDRCAQTEDAATSRHEPRPGALLVSVRKPQFQIPTLEDRYQPSEEGVWVEEPFVTRVDR